MKIYCRVFYRQNFIVSCCSTFYFNVKILHRVIFELFEIMKRFFNKGFFNRSFFSRIWIARRILLNILVSKIFYCIVDVHRVSSFIEFFGQITSNQ